LNLVRSNRQAGRAMQNTLDPPPLRRFSAVAPIAMSVAAFAVVMITLIADGRSDGPARPPDEGTAAHLFQLLLVGQVPIVAFFAIKWLPREPVRSMFVLGTQAFAAALALAPILWLGM
jgi:hypothetical protein